MALRRGAVSGLAGLLCLCGASRAAGPARWVLENEQVRLVLDDRAAVIELTGKQPAPGRNLISRRLPGFWKLIFHRGRTFENVVTPEAQQYRIERGGGGLNISVDRLRFGNETLDISLRFTVWLENDEVRWRARVENRAPVTIVDFYFPQIGGIESLGDPRVSDDLIWPQAAGIRIRNLLRALQRNEEQINTVTDPVIEAAYPGRTSMAWFEFTNGRRGIYFASYDPRFQAGILRVSRLYQMGGLLQFSFSKFLFLRQGETWTSGDVVVSPHPGTWHVGAERYGKWAAAWFRPQPRPEWVERMKGMLLVILRQQYGDRMWTYRDLPYLLNEARKCGMNTLGLFGWTEAGHDNQYPDYKPDPEMGGEAALRQGLADVAKAGGNTILYINGHIMDAAGPFYRETGERLAAKTIWGSPYYEQWNKYHQSSFLRHFNRKLFAPVCPGYPEWEDVMLKCGRRLLGYGATGLIYDQVGGTPPYPCIGNTRGEPESEAYSAGRRRMLSAIRDNLKKDHPGFGFMVEGFTDAYALYPDMIHGSGSGYQSGGNSFPQMTRYTFPRMVVTQRHPAPRAGRKESNYALAYGFRFELEVRYRADVETVRSDGKAHLREYMRKVSALRDRYWDLLGAGTFRDSHGLTNRNPALTATLFAGGNRHAVVIWNNTAKPQEVAVDMPGKRFIEAAGVEGRLSAAPRSLGPQELAVLIYE